MNAKLKGAFTQMKPVCDKMMVNPTPDNIKAYLDLANDMKKEFLQDLQQYMLFPIITHINSKEIEYVLSFLDIHNYFSASINRISEKHIFLLL